MVVYLNRKTLDSELLDTKTLGILTENFTYLVNNLIDYITPAPQNAGMPELVGGKRIITRALRGENLGYQYKTAASKSTISSKGTLRIKAFNTDVLVEKWEVSHPHITDAELKEIYPTHSSDGSPRGPYTCLITARVALQRKKETRCYVQCNCASFKASFYEKLNAEAYTNPQSLPASTGKIPQTPAMCKHLYAIYSKYYTKLVQDAEGFIINPSPILFANTPVVPVAPTIAKTPKELALDAIAAKLQSESNRLKQNQASYLDTTKNGYGYHLYMFSVRLLNGYSKVIYRNAASSPNRNKAGLQVLELQDPKIWKFFTTQKDHDKLWELIRKHTQEMVPVMKSNIKRLTGKAVYLEDNEMNTAIVALNEQKSSILNSMLELN